jgi:hypothetical protein
VVWRWPMTGESSSATTRRTELGWFTSSSSDHCPRTSNPSIYTSPYSFIAAAENFDALLQFSRPCRCCVFQFSDYSHGIALWFSKYECLCRKFLYTMMYCVVIKFFSFFLNVTLLLMTKKQRWFFLERLCSFMSFIKKYWGNTCCNICWCPWAIH